MSDNEDAEIEKKLGELQNYQVSRTGLLVSEEFKAVLTKVQELQHALFQRQHRNTLKINESVNELTKSSKEVEKLTHWLIGLTVVLAFLTGYDIIHRVLFG